MAEVLKKFGRYFLLDHLAQGGMAEIYRARMASVDGAGRLIVIKKIQAGYGSNAEFLQMFKSEIKVTMGFNHPNIVQLYDFGEEEKQPYIAMEMVDGKNLRQFSSRFNELKQTFPIELAVFIIEQAASGLHYAHSYKDKITGNPLNIVHRDISPQNILISYEGNVKVIDFGIAKATTNLESTRAGVIKGKPSYLSPEQISGDVLDGRSDIFALGAVFWELLTGKKLFAGENDLAVLKLIESCQTHVKPPSTLNPKIPKELDYIVLKTLAKQREKRYQSSEELQRALHKFLYGFMPEFNPSDLSYYAKDLFKNEIVEDRKKIQKLNEKVELLISSEIINSDQTPRGEAQLNQEDTTTLVDKRRGAPSGDREAFHPSSVADSKIEIDPSPLRATPKTSASNRPKSYQPSSTQPSRSTSAQTHGAPQQQRQRYSESSGSNPGKSIFAVGILLVIFALFGPQVGIRIPYISDILSELTDGGDARLTLQGNDKNVTVTVNGQVLARSLPVTLNGIPVGSPFQVSVTGSSGAFHQEITLKKGEKKAIPVIWNTSPNPGGTTSDGALADTLNDKSVLLKLSLSPGGGAPTIHVAGKSVDSSNPSVRVPLDQPLELSIERNGFKPFKREFVLESRQINGLKEWSMEIALEPLKFGFLTIHTTPSANASITLDGFTWTKKTPIENEKLPIGDYSIRLSNEVLGMEKTLSVSIQEGKAVNLDERLEIKN